MLVSDYTDQDENDRTFPTSKTNAVWQSPASRDMSEGHSGLKE